ncbi:MAG: hypothetical protein JW973_08685 [Bacteroidales bacterium]|nr:hypothetical protein [Bacteroidales bacterium]
MCFPYAVRIILLSSLLGLSTSCEMNDKDEYSIKICHLNRVVNLPSELNENSGMIWHNGLIWTINDSGDDPVIYAVDISTGNIIRRIWLSGTENSDWEEIAQDESFIYVGDIGNNEGTRTDLRIYKISKSELEDSVIIPCTIQYAYADQIDYTPALYNTPYDCEALICSGDTLYLFTKNWTGDYTSIYQMPAQQGNYLAAKVGQLQVEGQITASSYISDKKCLYLLGYNDYVPFLLILDNYVPEEAYTGHGQKYIFPENLGLQTEGIIVTDNGDILISCEKGYTAPAIYKVTQ